MDDVRLSTKQPVDPTSGVASVDCLASQINHHLSVNENDEAYRCLCKLLTERRDQPQIQVTAGLVALTIDKRAKAKDHFRSALEIAPDHFEATYNLVLLEAQTGNTEEAVNLLRPLANRHPDRADLKNDLAILLLNHGEVEQAFDHFKAALAIDPNFELARKNAIEFALENNLPDKGMHLLNQNSLASNLSEESRDDISMWRNRINAEPDTSSVQSTEPTEASSPEIIDGIVGKKIAFFASYQTFLTDIIGDLKKNNQVQVYDGNNDRDMLSTMQWADIAWFEWCDQNLIEATRLPKVCPIVCRLHSYEAFTEMPAQVDWSKVDMVVFVSEAVRELFLGQVKTPPPMKIIHNGVDLSRFTIPTDKKYGKRIASIGYINSKKNPGLLLYCFSKIHQYDPEYTFHIAGKHQDPGIHLYFEHYLERCPLPISFDGWVEDIPVWMADKDYVMSTSLFESFHYSIAEGMASGLMPLIHDWYGADRIYPKEYLFTDPDRCLDLLKRFEASEIPAIAQANRQFIAKRYDVDDKVRQISGVLKGIVQLSTAPTPEGS